MHRHLDREGVLGACRWGEGRVQLPSIECTMLGMKINLRIHTHWRNLKRHNSPRSKVTSTGLWQSVWIVVFVRWIWPWTIQDFSLFQSFKEQGPLNESLWPSFFSLELRLSTSYRKNKTKRKRRKEKKRTLDVGCAFMRVFIYMSNWNLLLTSMNFVIFSQYTSWNASPLIWLYMVTYLNQHFLPCVDTCLNTDVIIIFCFNWNSLSGPDCLNIIRRAKIYILVLHSLPST